MNIPVLNNNAFSVVTELPNTRLLDAFIEASANCEEIELVQLLRYAVPDDEIAGSVLRRCLAGSARLVPVYPSLNETPPEGSLLLGSILDGGLYLEEIETPYKDLHNKTIYDFTKDALLLDRIAPAFTKAEYLQFIDRNPLSNGFHLSELASITNNEALANAVAAEYGEEFAAFFNE